MKIKNNTPFQVIVNGQTYEAEVENVAAAPLVIKINGNPYTVELVETGSPVAVAAPVAVSAPAPVVAPVAAARPAAPAASSAADGNAIKAPMPGTIQGICVKAGQTVKYGDQLCLLEAMKMKNAIRAPRDGVIASVETQDDQKVTYGAVLFTLK